MRPIDADKLLARYKERCAGCKETKNYCEHCCDIADIISDIEDAPTEDVVGRKKGRWIGKPIAGYCTVRCSVCRNVFSENNGKWNFCPDCGADMRGEQDDQ